MVGGVAEAGEKIERLRVGPLAAEAGRRADAGKLDFADELAVGRKYFHLRLCILQIPGDEQIADQVDATSSFSLACGMISFQFACSGFANVDGDDPAARGVPVGLEIEDRAVVVDETAVRCRNCRSMSIDRAVGFAEIAVTDAIVVIGADPGRDESDSGHRR